MFLQFEAQGKAQEDMVAGNLSGRLHAFSHALCTLRGKSWLGSAEDRHRKDASRTANWKVSQVAPVRPKRGDQNEADLLESLVSPQPEEPDSS